MVPEAAPFAWFGLVTEAVADVLCCRVLLTSVVLGGPARIGVLLAFGRT